MNQQFKEFSDNSEIPDSKLSNNEHLKESKVNEKLPPLSNDNKNKKITEENTNADIRSTDEWMVRPCRMYKEEYDDCKSIKGRFHQYFIFGEFSDCTQWETDFQNCEKWEKKKDTEAFDAIVESETTRRINRLKGHYANDVWKKRDKPPEDWSKPLPEWLQKRNENSYLELKNQQVKSGIVNDMETHIPWCSIL